MTEIEADAVIQVQARAEIYGFLAWLFLEQPDKEFITHLVDNNYPLQLGELSSASEASARMCAGLETMRSSLTGGESESIDAVCQRLAVEHTRLMRGVARDYGPPPPYEALYRKDNAQRETDLLVKLMRFYRQVNAQLPVEQAERVDFLGLELDLMRLLCEEEANCLKQGDAQASEDLALQQIHFLSEHILAWVPGYCQLLSSQASSQFYQGVAQVLLGFLEEESADLYEGSGDSLEPTERNLSGMNGKG